MYSLGGLIVLLVSSLVSFVFVIYYFGIYLVLLLGCLALRLIAVDFGFLGGLLVFGAAGWFDFVC